MGYYDNDLNKLIGLTLSDIKVTNENNEDRIKFTASTGEHFEMFHEQNCCESVMIEEIIGDLIDLIGNPMLIAESVSSSDPLPGAEVTESQTCTFYKFSTIKGSVTIRWYGESNGYYSEEVSFIEKT